MISGSPIRFASREAAGILLAERLTSVSPDDTTVVAIPNDGVPVAEPLARRLGTGVVRCPVVRAVPAGHSVSVGVVFGWHGSALVCDDIVAALGVSDEVVASSLESARARLTKLALSVDEESFVSSVAGRHAVIVDDSTATGASMLGAATLVARSGAERITAATPVVSPYGLGTLKGRVDRIVYLRCVANAPFVGTQAYATSSDSATGALTG